MHGDSVIRKFQILAIDPAETVRCKDAISLLHLIRSHSGLWKDPKPSELSRSITDGEITLTVSDVNDSSNGGAHPNEELGIAFVIDLAGPFADIEGMREPLLELIKSQGFKPLYVLKDEVSEDIACQLYPKLYQIENMLRGYLIRFMATRIGPQWWEVTASTELALKANTRRKNETVFGKHIENSAYLIDVGELGEIVYRYSSGFRTREDIITRISNLEESVDAIKTLKQELKSNYQKLFKESFADKKFKEKWESFERLRNKIAHGNLFTADDLKTGEELAADISEIILTANKEASELILSVEEREAIQEQVVSQSAPSENLSAEGFLEALDEQQAAFGGRPDGFVGLKRFMNYLGSKGFSRESCQKALDRLQEMGAIEVHQVPNPKEKDRSTAAVRRPSF